MRNKPSSLPGAVRVGGVVPTSAGLPGLRGGPGAWSSSLPPTGNRKEFLALEPPAEVEEEFMKGKLAWKVWNLEPKAILNEMRSFLKSETERCSPGEETVASSGGTRKLNPGRRTWEAGAQPLELHPLQRSAFPDSLKAGRALQPSCCKLGM
ncbi:UPF0739 protein C1orf74 homolog isoform X3 [Dasypus novemcinctus]|uniref:UPF0739 protein C1orf74 homolog isoform X3 n=1 Tax=Dasypus novemcinctus TaxID=9361 RepID=UPI00265D6B1F|nr:UPF0739 protein C1orf74 homolog isoform X3 [Dasypus novemcinctus]